MKYLLLMSFITLTGCMVDNCVSDCDYPYIQGDMALIEIEGVI